MYDSLESHQPLSLLSLHKNVRKDNIVPPSLSLKLSRPPAKQWWHRDVSGSPDTPLLSRLSSTHPHLVGPEGNLKVPQPFDREGMVKLRRRPQGDRLGVDTEGAKSDQQIADS